MSERRARNRASATQHKQGKAWQMGEGDCYRFRIDPAARREERINEIKKSLEDIDRKIDSLKKRRDKVTSRLEYQVSPESEDARLAALLSDLRSKISELEEEKMRRLQISEKRINSTKQIAEIVAKIKTDGVAGDHPPDIQSPIEAQKSAYQEQDPQSVGT